MPNQISKTLEEIREYTQKNPELKKSHHFLFNCPLDSESDLADVIVIGLNPGETRPDWNYGTNLPTEESSEFDFHDELGRGRSSVRWSQLCKEYLPNNDIFLSEFFFGVLEILIVSSKIDLVIPLERVHILSFVKNVMKK